MFYELHLYFNIIRIIIVIVYYLAAIRSTKSKFLKLS